MADYKLINFNQLSKADIIFTTDRNSSLSTTIRTACNSIISHAMLVVDGVNIIDSTGTGVHTRSWETAKHDVTLAIVMRRKGLTNGDDQDKVVAVAKSFENRPYDKLGAAGSGMMGNTRNQILAGAGCVISVLACGFLSYEIVENAKDENADKAFFCSELVARSFTKAGFSIIDGKATNMTPNAVYISSWLSYVGHLIDTPLPPKPDKGIHGYRHDG
jgi:hypothetical protein